MCRTLNVEWAFIIQECSFRTEVQLSPSCWCSASASSSSTGATPACTSWEVGRGCTDPSWLSLQWKQDSSLVESNEKLLLTLGQVLSKCFVRDNPVSISTYIKWKQFTVTKPIVFYLSNVYFRWYHQKAFFFSHSVKILSINSYFLKKGGKMLFEIQGVSFSSL